jgi:hypothetical protein
MSTPTKMREPSPVQYAGLSIPLETFNSWVRNPAELQLIIGCFQTLRAHPGQKRRKQMIEDKYYLPVEQRMFDRHDRQWDRLGTGRSEDLPSELRERQEQEAKTLEERRMTLSLEEWLELYPESRNLVEAELKNEPAPANERHFYELQRENNTWVLTDCGELLKRFGDQKEAEMVCKELQDFEAARLQREMDRMQAERQPQSQRAHTHDENLMWKAMSETLPSVDPGSAIHLYLNSGGKEYEPEVMHLMYDEAYKRHFVDPEIDLYGQPLAVARAEIADLSAEYLRENSL